jgi:two-component system, OmpR family, sensor histidine kinase QseC
MSALAQPSIARRLLVTLLLAYLLVWGVVAGIAATSMVTGESGDFDREMHSVSNAIDNILAARDLPAEAALRGLSMKLAEDGRRGGLPGAAMGFRVVGLDGRVVGVGGVALPDLRGATPGYVDIAIDGRQWRIERHAVAHAAAIVEVGQSRDVRARLLRASFINTSTLAQLLVGLPLLAIPLWIAVMTGLAPLLKLSRALAARRAGDLEPIRPERPHRELVPLVDALNATLGRLSELLRRERAFLADAAHELRTPIAVISAQVDTLSQFPGDAEREAAMRRLRLGVARSARLVNQLLSLARLEADAGETPVAFDLADLVRDGIVMHATEASVRGIELGYVGEDRVPLTGARHAIENIVHNLLSNAIRHGRAPGQVEVDVRLAASGVTLSVCDDGVGIPPALRAQVFDRFWRAADAASGATGTGLGMAIVKAAARVLGAGVTLGEGLGGAGLGVVVTWETGRPTHEARGEPGTLEGG